MQRIKSYAIDLNKIKGKGDFNCPKCGVAISPNDETEEVYIILETIMKEDQLDKIILCCNKCRSRIHLTGFAALNKTSN